MQTAAGRILGLLLLFVQTAALYSSDYRREQEIHAVILQEYPELRGKPLALLLVSTGNCAGCSALAINHAITSLHETEPRLPCIVAVIAADPLQATTLRDRFFTPYVVADTLASHIAYASAHSAALPYFAVFDSKGTIAFHREDIQRHPPDYAASIAGIVIPGETEEPAPHTSKASVQRTTADHSGVPPVAQAGSARLQEPVDRSVRDVFSQVVAGSTLVGINYLTGHLEQWDISSGRILPPLKVPDTATYFYRPSAEDRAWYEMEKGGYEMSRFESLAATGDTLYAVVSLLVHYRVDTVVHASHSGSRNTVERWRRGQVVVRMQQGRIKSIIPIPAEYTLLGIAASNGYIGGLCSNALGAAKSDEDSVAYFLLMDARNEGNAPIKSWKVANTGTVFSAGAKAAAPGGAMWYCDPMQSQFLLLHPDGRHDTFTLRGTLRESGSPCRMITAVTDTGEVKIGSQFSFNYTLDNMAVAGDTLYALLTPAAVPSDMQCIVQAYTASSGTFITERTLELPALHSDIMGIHLLAADNGSARILLNTKDKGWFVVRVPLDGTPP